MRNAVNTVARNWLTDAIASGRFNATLDHCLIWSDTSGEAVGYWCAPGHGMTQDRDQAYPRTLQQALDETVYTDVQHVVYEILVRELQPPTTAEAAIAAAAVRPQRSRIRDLLTPGVLHQLQEFPENVTIRAMVLSQILKPIPDELKTYEAIVEWIETNVQPRRGDDIPFNDPRPEPQVLATTIAEQLRNGRGITVNVQRSATEHGHCTYVSPVHGRGTYTISQDDVLDILTQAVDDEADYDQIMNNLIDVIEEKINDNPPVLEIDWDEINHDNHESDETRDTENDFDTATIRNQLWQYIRNHADERIRRYFVNE